MSLRGRPDRLMTRTTARRRIGLRDIALMLTIATAAVSLLTGIFSWIQGAQDAAGHWVDRRAAAVADSVADAKARKVVHDSLSTYRLDGYRRRR